MVQWGRCLGYPGKQASLPLCLVESFAENVFCQSAPKIVQDSDGSNGGLTALMLAASTGLTMAVLKGLPSMVRALLM